MGMPVSELLARTSSYELSEWQVYEQVEGRVDNRWEQETLRDVHLLLQHLLDVTLRANGSKKGWKAEPIPPAYEDTTPRKKAPERDPAVVAAEREKFRKSLEERNRRRGWTSQSIQESMNNNRRDF